MIHDDLTHGQKISGRVIANEWNEYKVLATSAGEKLERWGKYLLLRPDPQIIWSSKQPIGEHRGIDARYLRDSLGGGGWEVYGNLPEEWVIGYKDLKFLVKPMGFKHLGLFPEQAANWDIIRAMIESSQREISVLNLFAYTGGATVAAAKAGAKVTHVDAAKGMNDRARQNAILSGVPEDRLRFITDDCAKFLQREIRRGKRYDAIIMDPPSYGRGPNKELWKLENDLYDFVKLSVQVLSDKPLFVLINSYTTGLQPTVIENILLLALRERGGIFSSYELCLPTDEVVLLPCGACGLWRQK